MFLKLDKKRKIRIVEHWLTLYIEKAKKIPND